METTYLLQLRALNAFAPYTKKMVFSLVNVPAYLTEKINQLNDDVLFSFSFREINIDDKKQSFFEVVKCVNGVASFV